MNLLGQNQAILLTKRQSSDRIYLAFVVLGLIIFLAHCSKNQSSGENEPNQWSARMAASVIERNPEPWMIDFREKPKWEYTQGLVLKAMWELWTKTNQPQLLEYVKAYYDQFIREDGSIWLYKMEDYNIDRINPGKVLFGLYRETGDEKYKKAIFLLREQMRTHPRTQEGGFWHKKRYPHQMWLDGLYMASPFLAEYAHRFDEPSLYEEVANQFVWMESHARDKETGLLYHGWDESKQQRWANPETGLSPHFWGRAMGWYAMGLVDALEFFPFDHPRRGDLIEILQRLTAALQQYQDPETGVWYQIVDARDQEGNYLESSASAMFVYAMLKAVKRGYIDAAYLEVARKGYQGILDTFIEVEGDGLVNINQACSVAGLGGDPYRDGSYEYYLSEPIRANDPKAVGPFILASLELESYKVKK